MAVERCEVLAQIAEVKNLRDAAQQVLALQKTALDKGAAGRDNAYGYGMVDYYRNGSPFTTANDGTHDDGPLSAGTYTYKVCLSGTSTCSADKSITF